MMITEEGGKHMYAMDVFSEAIGYLKRHAMYTFAESGLGITDKEIKWVLTVPGIWGDAAKQFMREAAEKVRNGKCYTFKRDNSIKIVALPSKKGSTLKEEIFTPWDPFLGETWCAGMQT